MSEMSVYDVSPNREKKVDLHVQYVRARTYKKVFAKIIDLLLLAVVGVLLFVATRATVQAFPAYQNIQERINTTLEDSGIYVKNGDDLIDSVDYYNSKKDDLSSSALMNQVEGVINKFYSYVDTLVTKGDIRNEDYQKMLSDYDEFREKITYSEIHLFIRDTNDTLIRNPDFSREEETYMIYVDNVYIPFIDSYLRGYLLTYFPQYLKDTEFMSKMILLVELPIAVFLSAILVYLVPPLIFRRNRQTIGRLIYKIGLINNDLFAVPLKKFLIYAVIVIFLEIALSFLTLAIPLIISISLMAFSKKKQDFAEYMVQIQQVDISKEKIYRNKEELEVAHLKLNRAPVQFKNITFDENP